MKRLLLIMLMAIVGFTVLLAQPIRQVPLSQIEMIERSMQSVVTVYCPYIDIPASGFYIGNGIIVTAGHVSSVEGVEKVTFEDGTEYPVLNQITHPDYDCGFLQIANIDKPVLVFDSIDSQRGETVFVLGNPGGLVFNVSKGIVSSDNRYCNGYFGETTLIGYDAATTRGSSGSLVIDEDGEVRGINVGNYGFHGSAVAITTHDILKALDAVGLQRPNLGDDG